MPESTLLFRFRLDFLLPFAFVRPAFAQHAFHLQPNDTGVSYGDSVTYQCLYATFVETNVVTLFPLLPVKSVHS